MTRRQMIKVAAASLALPAVPGLASAAHAHSIDIVMEPGTYQFRMPWGERFRAANAVLGRLGGLPIRRLTRDGRVIHARSVTIDAEGPMVADENGFPAFRHAVFSVEFA